MRLVSVLASLAAGLALAGCSSAPTAGPVPVQGNAIRGRVMGGQQPVASATVQLWQTGASGYGSASTQLITGSNSVSTDAQGIFTITGTFTCPAASSTPVYLTVTEGYPLPSSSNPNLALMAALGPCDGLVNIPFVNVDEVTTVASVWALAPFMKGMDRIGTSPTNALGLLNAFATVNKLVDIATGMAGGPALPAGATIPTDEINALADILATCINSSGGTDNNGSSCGTLFHNTKVGTTAPTDTITAAMNIAQNPSANVAALFAEIPSIGAIFPTNLSQSPAAWTLVVSYIVSGIKAPRGIANDASGNVWIANSGDDSVTLLNSTGTMQFHTVGAAGSVPYAIAVDANGGAWLANSGNATLVPVTGTGSIGAAVSGNGLNAPKGIAIDAAGNVWAANSSTGGGVSVFTSSGGVIGSYSGGVSAPSGIAVNPQ
ncbi:MAG TPA: hypothetical protein VGB94_00545 [Acidobacteriaceae bacterium]